MIILILLILAGLLVYGVFCFNNLVKMRQLTRNAWSDVDVYLKRRAELIPNVVNTVQAYAKHEQALLEALAASRSLAISQQSLSHDRFVAENQVGTNLWSVLALKESYPELKSNTNFEDLQRQLVETEKLIANARQYYNACVRDYNILTEAFPTSIFAGMGGFKEAEFFELSSAAEAAVPKI